MKNNTVTISLEDYNELRDFKTNMLNDENYPVMVCNRGKFYFLNETDAIFHLRTELEQSNAIIEGQKVSMHNLKVKNTALSLELLQSKNTETKDSLLIRIINKWLKIEKPYIKITDDKPKTN